MKTVIAVDFDGVLHHEGQLIPENAVLLEPFRDDARFVVIIYTARNDIGEVQRFLDRHHIYYTAIRGGKMFFDILIDDKAYNVSAMSQTLQDVRRQ